MPKNKHPKRVLMDIPRSRKHETHQSQYLQRRSWLWGHVGNCRGMLWYPKSWTFTWQDKAFCCIPTWFGVTTMSCTLPREWNNDNFQCVSGGIHYHWMCATHHSRSAGIDANNGRRGMQSNMQHMAEHLHFVEMILQVQIVGTTCIRKDLDTYIETRWMKCSEKGDEWS